MAVCWLSVRTASLPRSESGPSLVNLYQARAGRVLSAERAAPTCCFEASLSC